MLGNTIRSSWCALQSGDDPYRDSYACLFLQLSDGSLWSCGRADGFELGIGEEQPAWIALQNELSDERELIKAERAAARARLPQQRIEDTAMADGDTALGPEGFHSVEHSQAKQPIILDEFIPYPVPILFPPPPTLTHSPSKPTQYIDHPIEFYSNAALSSPIGQRVASMSCGMHFNFAVTEAGHCYSWGYGVNSELGRGQDVEESRIPGRIVLRTSKAQDGWMVDSAHAGGQHCFIVARQTQTDS